MSLFIANISSQDMGERVCFLEEVHDIRHQQFGFCMVMYEHGDFHLETLRYRYIYTKGTQG